MTNGQQLLVEYARTGAETAFRELVAGYVDLVYSAAVRLVNGDRHLAEDVTQTVFADLARLAPKLSSEVMVGGWLHRHTCFVASKIMRGERRRQLRERQSVEMESMEDHSAANLGVVTPHLDEAINQLGVDDRQAVLLRFFEQRDFRDVGVALGSNEDAARKRVSRALEKLHSLLAARGVVFSATALASALTAHAVTAAPAGLALNICTTALAGTAVTAGGALSILNIMAMTKLKVGLVGVMIAAGVGIPWAIHHQSQSKLAAADDRLRQRSAEIEQLALENARLAKLAPAKPAPATNEPSGELLRLRGEVARLRHENALEAIAEKTNGPSVLSGITASPEMLKLIRDQQKAGMNMVYRSFGKTAKLSTEKSEQLTELLADHVMENIDHVTAILRDKKTPQQMEEIFAEQEAALDIRVQALLGPEAFAQYQEYTRNLGSHITAEQFKSSLTGETAAKAAKAKQIYQVMQEETQRALAQDGLAPDYQIVPTMNFRNIASEQEGDKNLQLLDRIYARATDRASGFLNEEEVQKFAQFRTNVIAANRASLIVNRKMMAPITK